MQYTNSGGGTRMKWYTTGEYNRAAAEATAAAGKLGNWIGWAEGKARFQWCKGGGRWTRYNWTHNCTPGTPARVGNG